MIERRWFAARAAVAAAPLLSATSLGRALSKTVKDATRLIDAFSRARQRQRGHLPLEAPALWPETPSVSARDRRLARRGGLQRTPLPHGSCPPSLPSVPLERREFEFGELDRWLDLADQAIRRVQRVLDQHAPSPAARAGSAKCLAGSA